MLATKTRHAFDVVFMIDWNIQSRAHACQACGKPFLDKQPYHTLLFDQKAGYERLDVCAPCWAAQYSHGATAAKDSSHIGRALLNCPPFNRSRLEKKTPSRCCGSWSS